MNFLILNEYKPKNSTKYRTQQGYTCSRFFCLTLGFIHRRAASLTAAIFTYSSMLLLFGSFYHTHKLLPPLSRPKTRFRCFQCTKNIINRVCCEQKAISDIHINNLPLEKELNKLCPHCQTIFSSLTTCNCGACNRCGC